MPLMSQSLFQIRMRQTFLGQNIVNIFYFAEVDTGDVVLLAQVLTAFKADVYDTIITAQQNSVMGLDLRARRIGGVQEDTLSLLGDDGLRPGPALNSFSAWGFKLDRTTIDTRNGSKRFTGISETDVEGNEPASLMDTILDDVAAVLAINLAMANGAILEPVIFRQGSFVDPDWFGNFVSDAIFTAVTSQVSRKAKPG